MATTTTLMNLGDGTCVVVKRHAYEVMANPLSPDPTVINTEQTITLEDYSGKVLRPLTRDEAKALLEAKGFLVE